MFATLQILKGTMSMPSSKWSDRIWGSELVSCHSLVEIELIFALRAAGSEIRSDFQNCHIWSWYLEFEKVAEAAHVPSVYHRVSNLSLLLCSTARGIPDRPICTLIRLIN